MNYYHPCVWQSNCLKVLLLPLAICIHLIYLLIWNMTNMARMIHLNYFKMRPLDMQQNLMYPQFAQINKKFTLSPWLLVRIVLECNINCNCEKRTWFFCFIFNEIAPLVTIGAVIGHHDSSA